MALTKTKNLDIVQINEDFIITYRQATRVFDDDEFIGEKYKRSSVTPGETKEGHPKIIRDLIDLLHTPEVIAAYQAKFTARQLP